MMVAWMNGVDIDVLVGNGEMKASSTAVLRTMCWKNLEPKSPVSRKVPQRASDDSETTLLKVLAVDST